RRETPRQTVAGLPSAESLDERFPRDADHDRVAERRDLIKVPEEREVVLLGLPKPDSGIHRDRLRGDARSSEGPDPLRQERADLSDDIVVFGVGLHRLWIAEHVHHDGSDTAAG